MNQKKESVSVDVIVQNAVVVLMISDYYGRTTKHVIPEDEWETLPGSTYEKAVHWMASQGWSCDRAVYESNCVRLYGAVRPT